MRKKFKERLKKQVTVGLATILTVGAIPILEPIDIYAGSTVTYVKSDLGSTSANVTFRGDNAGADTHTANTVIAVDKDNSNNYGYCISAGLPTVDKGDMVLDTKDTLTEKDKIVLGIMNAGFPNNSHGLDQKNAYLATEIAIKHYTLQHPSDYYNAYWGSGSREEVKFNNDDWSHWSGDSNIINVAKTIYDTGLANPYTGNDDSGTVTVSATDDGVLQKEGEFLNTVISINSTSPYTSGTLTFDDPIMQSMGATVTVDGVVTPINNNTVQLPANAKTVVVSVDKTTAETAHEQKYPGDENASNYLTVNATISTVGNGGSSLNIGINRLGHNGQNYAIMMQGNDISTQQSIKWNRTTNTFIPTPSKLKIVKVEDGTTKGLAGAIFKITSHVEGMEGVLGTYTTDSSGEINLDAIVGWYEVEEITPPAGYTLSDNNHQDIYVAEEVESVVTFENKKKPPVRAFKVDGKTNKPLAGATIRLALDGGNEYTELVTDSAGKVEFDDLDEGTYVISEQVAPSGYLLNETKYTVKVVAGSEVSVTIPNFTTPTTTLIKYDEATGLPLENAEFSLSKKDGSIIFEGMTGADGTITVDDLETGWYTWSEIAPPSNYFMTTPSKDFYLEAGKHVTVKFDNRLKPSLLIKKIDGETGLPLAGAVIKVSNTEGKTIGEFTTDSKGEIALDNLDEGIYNIQEVTSPSGYSLNSELKTVKLEWTNQVPPVATIVVLENYKKPTLIVTKYDEATGLVLPLAEFSVAEKGGVVINEGLTDSEGKFVTTGLKEGWYTITELAPPNKYFITTPTRDVYLKNGETLTVKIDNRLKPSLEITKIDGETGTALAGVTFKIEKEDGSFYSEFVTDKDGKILLENVEEGVYTITEIISSSGYVLNGTPKTINLKWQSDNTFVHTLVFDNYTKPSLIVEKYDEMTNELLPNAQFRIEGVNNNFLWEGVLSKGDLTSGATKEISGTLEDGRIVINGLEPGTYKITEINPPQGYTFSDTTENPRTVVIKENSTTTVKIDNRPLPDLEILKIDSVTKEPLKNATFEIKNLDEDFAIQKQTDENGIIKLTDIAEGNYVITEKSAPINYILDSANTETIKIKWNGGDNKDGQYSLVFENTLKPTLVINKTSGLGGFGLAGAKFEVQYKQNDGGLKNLGTFTTNSVGQIVLPYVNEGWYVVTEVKAPAGYQLPSNPTKEIYLSKGENSYSSIDTPSTANEGDITVSNGSGVKVTYGADIKEIASLFSSSNSVVYASSIDFDNYPLNSIVIKKTDALTGRLLDGATFELIKVAENISGSQGTTIGTYTTDYTGVIVITGLTSGHYLVRETQAPLNYDLNVKNQQQAYLAEDGTSIIELMFSNYPYGKLVVNKMDKDTREPLSGATFEVTNSKGEYIGTSGNGHYTTDVKGTITFDNLPPDSYVVTEIKAPNGYTIDQENNVKVVEIGYGETKEVDFYNQAYSTLVIKKLDNDTKEPLANAEFKITNSDGTVVGDSNGIFVTDKNGLITIPNLPLGTYVVTETKAPTDYILADSTQTIEIKGNATQTLTFYNTKKSSVQIIKIDSKTKQPLKGAEFKVYKANGELINTFVTDGDGLIILPNLENGWYKAIESKAPNGYLIDDTAQDFEVKGNQFIKLTFENTPMGGLTIIKTNSNTGEKISGVEFEINKANGEKVLNENNTTKFVTDKNGQINLPNLADGTYVVTETKQADGYIIDPSPKTVIVKAGVPTVLEVKNTPAGGLVIIKTDENTGEPLQGVEFDVLRADGSRVVNDILTNNQPNTENNSPNHSVNGNGVVSGSYVTDKNGKIYLNHLKAGEYHITETKALDGYELDSTVYTVTVRDGKQETLKVTNKQKASLRIIKIDSVTGVGIYNVEFMIFDKNGTVVKTVYTDNNGIVDVEGLIEEDTYTIRETRQAEGYYPDDIPRTVKFKSGEYTEIVWKNTPQKGQIQVYKTSADNNIMNGLPAGTPLEGAIFEVYNYRNGNLVDRFITAKNGYGVSSPLPLGRYTVKEVKAPNNYSLSNEVLDVEIEFPTQILKLNFTNKSLDLRTTIRKTGLMQVIPKQDITYTIFDVTNNSSVSLDSFYWRDTMPNAIRATKLETGTYNMYATYKIVGTTNTGRQVIIADNISSLENRTISLSNASLGLSSNEYLTSYSCMFGTVGSGFKMTSNAKLTGKVVGNLPHGYEFANKVDVGGLHGSEWVISNDTWVTTVYNPVTSIPKTGY